MKTAQKEERRFLSRGVDLAVRLRKADHWEISIFFLTSAPLLLFAALRVSSLREKEAHRSTFRLGAQQAGSAVDAAIEVAAICYARTRRL